MYDQLPDAFEWFWEKRPPLPVQIGALSIVRVGERARGRHRLCHAHTLLCIRSFDVLRVFRSPEVSTVELDHVEIVGTHDESHRLVFLPSQTADHGLTSVAAVVRQESKYEETTCILCDRTNDRATLSFEDLDFLRLNAPWREYRLALERGAEWIRAHISIVMRYFPYPTVLRTMKLDRVLLLSQTIESVSFLHPYRPKWNHRPASPPLTVSFYRARSEQRLLTWMEIVGIHDTVVHPWSEIELVSEDFAPQPLFSLMIPAGKENIFGLLLKFSDNDQAFAFWQQFFAARLANVRVRSPSPGLPLFRPRRRQKAPVAFPLPAALSSLPLAKPPSAKATRCRSISSFIMRFFGFLPQKE